MNTLIQDGSSQGGERQERRVLLPEEVRDLLASECKAAGSQRNFAVAHGVSEKYVSLVLAGKQDAGPLLQRALGISRRVVYELVPESPHETERELPMVKEPEAA